MKIISIHIVTYTFRKALCNCFYLIIFVVTHIYCIFIFYILSIVFVIIFIRDNFSKLFLCVRKFKKYFLKKCYAKRYYLNKCKSM